MPSAPSVRDEIAQAIPEARFEVESRIRLGRVAMAFVKPVVRLVLDEDEEARAIIGAIKRVDVATYRVTDLPDSVDLAAIRGIEGRLTRNGWSTMVRSREDKDNTWVFTRHRDDGSIRGLLVVELDESELTIVGVEGRIDEILANAIADEPRDFTSFFDS